MTSRPGEEIQSEGEGKKKGMGISGGRDGKTHPLTEAEKEIDREIKYEKCSII